MAIYKSFELPTRTSGSCMRNLSFAKQRFDSSAKFLARRVWKLDAVIATCQRLGLQRLSAEVEPLTVTLLGMMADATDECSASGELVSAGNKFGRQSGHCS